MYAPLKVHVLVDTLAGWIELGDGCTARLPVGCSVVCRHMSVRQSISPSVRLWLRGRPHKLHALHLQVVANSPPELRGAVPPQLARVYGRVTQRVDSHAVSALPPL